MLITVKKQQSLQIFIHLYSYMLSYKNNKKSRVVVNELEIVHKFVYLSIVNLVDCSGKMFENCFLRELTWLLLADHRL